MDALCEFIDFWTGKPDVNYGESSSALAEISLPDPLKRLYGFIGQWPSTGREQIAEFGVPLLSYQDCLLRLNRIKIADDGKIIFLHENQGVWDCRTLPEGVDPPVWCNGDQVDEEGKDFRGERVVSDSLSQFLVTFALQEISLASRMEVCDDGLDEMFDNSRTDAVPLWLNGEYVYGRDHNFYMWGDVLVASMFDTKFFAANSDAGIEFLTSHQGPLNKIGLIVGMPWSLDINDDGSSNLRFLRGTTDESCEAPADTFDFPQLLEALQEMSSDIGHYEKNAMVFLHRKGFRGGVSGEHIHDHQFVTSLFEKALGASRTQCKALKKLFRQEWPLR
jgi:hypothetical protein